MLRIRGLFLCIVQGILDNCEFVGEYKCGFHYLVLGQTNSRYLYLFSLIIFYPLRFM